MNEQRKNNGRGIFYGVIGVATLVVAIIGATFAYFTAVGNVNGNTITGNMATVTFGVTVTKMTHADEVKGGMIPMSNAMVNAATTNASTKGVCVDDPGNAVCQVYKIKVTNGGSASLFVDGYVDIVKGSGDPTRDLPDDATSTTTMRWAQVWCTEGAGPEGTNNQVTTCATSGDSTVGSSTATQVAGLPTGSATGKDAGFNTNAILTENVTGTATISGNSYDVINKNYIRIGSGATADTLTDKTYKRTDITSALVFNQYLDPSSTTATTDEATMYIVVWLSETGENQSANSEAGSESNVATSPIDFFTGKVYFVSGQGAEVTATFSDVAKVKSDSTSNG